MLKSITISHVWVLDQDEALKFYVDKLGLEVGADQNLGFMRWLTVHVPGDENRQILLELPAPPSVDPQAAEQIRGLITKGASGLSRSCGCTSSATRICNAVYCMSERRGLSFSSASSASATKKNPEKCSASSITWRSTS